MRDAVLDPDTTRRVRPAPALAKARSPPVSGRPPERRWTPCAYLLPPTGSLTARRDALLRTDGPVRTLVDLALAS